jgi:hypothetical protein
MELLKAMQEMMANMKADQAKAEADRKVDQAQMVANMKTDKEDMKADRKADQEMMETQIGSLASKMDTNQAQMEERLKEAMKVTVSAIEGKMEAIVHSTRSGRDEKTQARSEKVTERQEIPKEGAAVANLEQGPKEMESGAERQMVPMEEVERKSSRTKKQPRGRRVAAGRRIKPTRMTRGDGKSEEKLVAACRKVYRCAAVAWRRRNIFRNLRTQGHDGLQQKLGAARKMVTLRAKLAWRKGTFVRKNRFGAKVEQGTRTARTRQEGEMDMKDPGGRWLRYLLKGRTSTTDGIREWKSEQPRLKNERTTNEICRKIIRLELGKRVARSYVAL